VARFGLVGVVVMLCFMAMNALFGRFMSAQAAFFAAYPPALGLHFLLNKRWTFQDRRATSGRHVAEYLHAVVVTFLIQWPVFALGVHLLGWKAWFAAGVANVAQMTASFLLLQLRVFRPAPAEPGNAAAWHRLAALLASGAICALLAWTALQKWEFPPVHGRQADYYNLLAHGFSKGSLALDLPVPDALRHAENPWDASKRPPGSAPADLSYYGGKFYLYFGAVPVVVLLWPFQLLTGQDLPFVYVVIFFCAGAYLLLARLWLAVLHDHFPAAGLVTRLGGLGLLGLAGGLLSLARRASIWEMPIAAGQFFMAAMVLAAYRALHAGRPWRWLAAAGLFLGLAVGCRPTLIVAGGGLAVLVLAVGRSEFPRGGWAGWARRSVRAALAAGIPLALVVGGLLAYNHARFGRALEFGLNYQLTGGYEAKAVHFSPGFVRYNWLLYFWDAPQWGRDFPFVHPVKVLPPPPAGYYGYEYVYGALMVNPVIWLALLLPRWALARDDCGRLAGFIGLLLALAAGLTGLLLCFNTAAARYTADFLPWWVLLGLAGWASAERWLQSRAGPRRIGAGLFGAAVGFSCVVAFCASVELHGVFQFLNPAGYAAVARAFDQPVALWEKWSARPGGPLDLTLVFAERPAEALEPLVTTGVSYETDYVFVHYTGPDSFRVGVLHNGRQPVESGDLRLEPHRPYRIRIDTGALYPPREHPYFASWSQVEIVSLKQWVTLWVDDRMVVDEYYPLNDASPGSVQVGTDTLAHRRFSGTIVAVRQAGLPERKPRPDHGGDVLVQLQFTRTANPLPQPLVQAGRTGNADFIAVRRRDEETFGLGYESWSAGYWESGPLPIPSDHTAALRIRLGSMLDLDDHSPLGVLRDTVAVLLGDRPVWWWRTVVPLPARPPVEVGANSIGSTAVATSYQGRLLNWARLPAPVAWRRGPFAQVALTLGGRGVGTEPLAATGVRGQADTLAIEWRPGGRARLLWDHWGGSLQRSREFDWPEGTAHQVRLELPSFARLDDGGTGAAGTGMLRAWVDEPMVWEEEAPFYLARSDSVVLGRNAAGSTIARDRLEAVVLDVRQSPPLSPGPGGVAPPP